MDRHWRSEPIGVGVSRCPPDPDKGEAWSDERMWQQLRLQQLRPANFAISERPIHEAILRRFLG